MLCNQGRTKGWPTDQLPGTPTHKGHWKVTGIIGSMVPVYSGFLTRKNFSENHLHFRYAPWKMFASPVLGRKRLKNIVLKGRQIIRVIGAPTCLGPALCTTYVLRRLVLWYMSPSKGGYHALLVLFVTTIKRVVKVYSIHRAQHGLDVMKWPLNTHTHTPNTATFRRIHTVLTSSTSYRL
jgi:hypothetical protein